jgi:hypothetical protein
MHNKYAAAGLKILTVTLDESPAEVRDRLQKFLRDKLRAPFETVQLDVKNSDKSLVEKLIPEGVPVIFVFDRDNRTVHKLDKSDDEDKYATAEKAIAELLKK